MVPELRTTSNVQVLARQAAILPISCCVFPGINFSSVSPMKLTSGKVACKASCANARTIES